MSGSLTGQTMVRAISSYHVTTVDACEQSNQLIHASTHPMVFELCVMKKEEEKEKEEEERRITKWTFSGLFFSAFVWGS